MPGKLAFTLAIAALGAAIISVASLAQFGEAQEVVRSTVAEILPAARRFDPQPIGDRLAADGYLLGMEAHLRIYKEEGLLEVWLKRGDGFELARAYPVCRWSGSLGPKLKEGDRQSPEGFYEVSKAQLKPDSAYWRALNLGFPNAYDTQLGRTGSFLMIHGDCVSIGCYAMTDAGMDDIYRIVEAALDAGQASVPVHVFPFRMTEENLERHRSSPWFDFWLNLAQGEAHFLEGRQPPRVYACNGTYRFAAPGEAGDTDCEPVSGW